ncbi:MAG: UDP-N-acetylmuramoyl-tripeptide--D-alanyl-D-alanine ligase [Patescibacteria group bacterium]
MMRKILQKITKFLAQLVVRRYQPKVIAITGSVGKTSTKEAIRTVLEHEFKVRSAILNQNNEIGVPLTILGEQGAGKNIMGWVTIFLHAVFLILIKSKNYPQILILEYGIDKPGDMDYLLSIAKPLVGVMTSIGEIPAHVEFFSGSKALAKEKSKMIYALPERGLAVLNFDDAVVSAMQDITDAKCVTYGFGQGADILGDEISILQDVEKGLLGTTFKVHAGGSFVPVRILGSFGKPQAYAILAAFGVGMFLGMNLVEISQALQKYQSLPGRTKVIPGIKNSLIIDDTYNASPLSMHAALDFLQGISASRKIVVLGDMLEIGKYSEEAHRSVGDKAKNIADFIITVGERAKFIYQEALENNFSQDNLKHFETSKEAGEFLDRIIEAGDVVLVKGSRAMRMEKVVYEIMEHPEESKKLLVKDPLS